ncbi:hypothetical protein CDAR_29011 [Caerostris darwini]|uniref:Uncharacterized protein n=1 Tax=Caerostris darwini TaxID=1538125 RepID=A0AAV4N8T9_9ARAC|nr:hypothetical protein CDAR_29011 [Caerostris darwini]
MMPDSSSFQNKKFWPTSLAVTWISHRKFSLNLCFAHIPSMENSNSAMDTDISTKLVSPSDGFKKQNNKNSSILFEKSIFKISNENQFLFYFGFTHHQI